MKLELWVKDKWSIFGLVAENATPSAELDELAQQNGSQVDGLFVLLDNIAKQQEGPKVLNDSICHVIDRDHGIWQFSKGRIRLLWFYDEGRCIICTQAFLKKSQTTPKDIIKKAIRLRTDYFTVKGENGGRIEVITTEE